MRWALLGASDIAATRILPALRSIGDVAQVVRSRDQGHASRWASRHGVSGAVTDLYEAVDRRDVDAVYVSTRNSDHREAVEAAAGAGKHVLVEKPLALSLVDGQAMIDSCNSAGVTLAVNHHLPAADVQRALRAKVEEGVIGQPRAVRVGHAIQLPDRLATWRLTDPEDGGVVVDIAVHDAAAISALLKQSPERVTALGLNQANAPGRPADAVMLASVWSSDVLCQVHVAYNNPHLPTSLEILGTDGALSSMDCNGAGPGGSFTIWRNGSSNVIAVPAVADAYVRTVTAFRDAVRGTGNVIVGGPQALESLAFALAAAESLHVGATVSVDRKH
jgi:1,5-anhydro-D-fructose reductase (1,5-anhydro-D-mannitol-forming)